MNKNDNININIPKTNNNKNNKYAKNMFNNWKNNNTMEEKTNPIIDGIQREKTNPIIDSVQREKTNPTINNNDNNNNYSLMNYGLWLGVKNYDEKCSTFNNTSNFDNNTTDNIIEKSKNNVKIYVFMIICKFFVVCLDKRRLTQIFFIQ
jgi:hypothetical protein